METQWSSSAAPQKERSSSAPPLRPHVNTPLTAEALSGPVAATTTRQHAAHCRGPQRPRRRDDTSTRRDDTSTRRSLQRPSAGPSPRRHVNTPLTAEALSAPSPRRHVNTPLTAEALSGPVAATTTRQHAAHCRGPQRPVAAMTRQHAAHCRGPQRPRRRDDDTSSRRSLQRPSVAPSPRRRHVNTPLTAEALSGPSPRRRHVNTPLTAEALSGPAQRLPTSV
ncbi:unnamed protein product [Gadus morhua 'NCC']